MKLFNEKGMALVEVMAASAIMGGLALAGMSLFKNQNKAQKSIEQNYEVTSTLSAIRGILASRDNCIRNLVGKTPTTAANVFTQITKVKNGVDLVPAVYPVNGNLPGTSVKINSYALSKSYGNLASDETMLVISFSRGNGSIKDEITKTVKINYTLDGAGKINACYAVTSGETDSLWQIATNLTDIFYNSGNVGIGTTNPTFPLEVRRTGEGYGIQQHSIGQYSGILLKTENTSAAGVRKRSWGIGNMNEYTSSTRKGLEFIEYEDPNGNDTVCESGEVCLVRMTITSGGKVGIGTNAPDSLLHTLKDFNGLTYVSAAHIEGTDAGPTNTEVKFLQKGAVGGFADFGLINAIAGGSSKFYVRGDGNVGIGTTNPKSQLQIGDSSLTTVNQLMLGDTTSGEKGIRIHYNNLSSSSSYEWSVIDSRAKFFSIRGVAPAVGGDASVDRLTINLSSGNVGIGTASPARTFYVNGSSGGTAAWENLSDRRLKKEIQIIPDSLQKVLSLRGVTFMWKHEIRKDVKFTEKKDMGVIAQEVEKVFPEAVNTDDKGFQFVAYTKLIGPLIESVKELYHSLVGVKSELANQNDRFAKIEKQVHDLKNQNEELRKQNAELLEFVRAEKNKKDRILNKKTETVHYK